MAQREDRQIVYKGAGRYFEVQKELLTKRGYSLDYEDSECGIFRKKEKKQENGKEPEKDSEPSTKEKE